MQPQPPECCLLQLFSKECFEIVKTIPSFFTAVIALLAYRMGKTYFNQTQKNAVSLQEINKSLDALNLLKSLLVNVKLQTSQILRSKVGQSELEALFKALEGSVSAINENKTKVLFVDGVQNVHKMFEAWHEKWFSNADDLSQGLFTEISPEKRESLLNKISKNIEIELEACINEVDTIRTGLVDPRKLTVNS